MESNYKRRITWRNRWNC